MSGDALDCTRCGICCVNPTYNAEAGFRSWVEVEPEGALLRRRDLVRKHVEYDAAGVPHLRLDVAGRCLALRGRLGDRVRCDIYAQRPRGCRRVQPGDTECLRLRSTHGLGH